MVFLSGGAGWGGGHMPPPKTTMFFSVWGGMVFLTFKWGGRVGGAHAPPHLKPLCFLVCVWVRLMWKSGGGNLGGGGKWGASGVPPHLKTPWYKEQHYDIIWPDFKLGYRFEKFIFFLNAKIVKTHIWKKIEFLELPFFGRVIFSSFVLQALENK